MTQKVLFKGPFAPTKDTDWTRSFPEGSVEGDSWMLDVVDDLKAYAEHHSLSEAEAILRDTRERLRRVVAARED